MRPLRSGDPVAVNDYPLTGFLGEGGQGSVYAGVASSGQRVAIKILHARFADDPQALRRFRREAEATRRVGEFCTARVLEIGDWQQRPYIVSEFVDGPSLQAHGPLTGTALMRLAVTTAQALVAIHRAGVVHRDFKPSNVLLAAEGPRVIDFGIARALDVSHSLTSSVIGTPAYMSPEQFHGESGPPGDVFAWAGTIVFAATGRPAFGTGALPVVMHRILAYEPDLGGVPGELAGLLRAALHKDPGMRPTAEQLVQELLRAGPPPAAFTAGPPPPPAPSPLGHSAPPSAPSLPNPGSPSSGPSPIGPGGPHPAAPTPGMGRYPAPAPHTPVTRPAGNGVRAAVAAAGAVILAAVIGVAVWLWPGIERQLLAGGGQDPATTSAGASTPTPATTGKASAFTAIVNPSTARGGTLRAAFPKPDSLDPGNTYDSHVWNLVRLYGRSLTMFRPEPGVRGTEVVPDLAESLGTPGDDAKTWTYKIRQGLKFQDGTPITAADVKYAVLRSMDREVLQSGPSTLQFLLDLPGDYSGPAKSGADGDRAVLTPDDRTIVFKLKAPFSGFDKVMTLPVTVPVPKSADRGARYRDQVVSSGPYMFSGEVTDTALTLVRNPHWDPATDPVRKALPDRYEVGFLEPGADAQPKLEGGDLEYGPSPAETGRITSSSDLRARSDESATTLLNALYLNPRIKPLDDPDCRKAIFTAVDRTMLLRAYGDADPAATLLPPVVAGHREHGLYPTGAPDQAKTRAHLSACDKSSGFPLTLLARSDRPAELAAAEVVEQSLSPFGIEITVKQVSTADFYAKYSGKPDALTSDRIGLVSRPWVPDYADAEAFLAPLVDGRVASGFNLNVDSAEVDSLIDQANRELDQGRRAQLWGEVDRVVMEEALILPTGWRRAVLLRGVKATNVHVNPHLQLYDLLNMGVAG
ncbi:ABC transporter substrate-binding protein [Nonomuraea soli]|uniref:Peptide/nickel transport system substrate-binding protein n=1 Tax=Nonomuraea soli TaxID=1032476 RepID=A0A7W0CT63_9ACTN|nr:ABC transporter substrate-binding protein [Nonomuraea soli]MBA2896690.1 peptide/nickel transport system substrate-binding protein [Nonomuraea soli]